MRAIRWAWLVAIVTAILAAVPLTIAAAFPRHAATASHASSCAVPVTTADGVVCGVTRKGWREYLGVPYAAPPTGSRRWQPPQPATPWSVPRQATAPGQHCAGLAGNAGTEDCLWLSVYVPPGTAAADRLPVMVWVHGGGFTTDDDSGNGIGNGRGSAQELATNDHIIVVRVSYRLGVLGFLAATAFGAAPGNYGIEDQQAAMRWVKANIAQFGGDKHNVTLDGQSAGAVGVCLNLESPQARGLYQRAIIQSGWYQPFVSAASCAQHLPAQAQAEATAATLAKTAGCASATDVAACLRAVPLDTLLTDAQGLSFTPYVGGHLIPQQPMRAFASGHFTHVPVIDGVTRNEGLPDRVASMADFTQTVDSNYGSDAARVIAAYPQNQYPAPGITYGAIVSDQAVCSALTAANSLARWVPVYLYRYDDATEPFFLTQVNKGNLLAGAYHASELPALFPGWAIPPRNQLTTFDQEVMIPTVMQYWGAFARTGAPEAQGFLPWPQYTGHGSVMTLQAAFDEEVLPVTVLRRTHHCSFWDTISPR